jgi:hypothetical protein
MPVADHCDSRHGAESCSALLLIVPSDLCRGSCSAAHMAAPRTTSLNSLSDDVLDAIFLLLPSKDRCSFMHLSRCCWRIIDTTYLGFTSMLAYLTVVQLFCFPPVICRAGPVPQVCRRWHRITAQPSMWQTVDMTPRHPSVVPWLRQRSSSLRHLTLHVRRCNCHCTMPSCCMAWPWPRKPHPTLL